MDGLILSITTDIEVREIEFNENSWYLCHTEQASSSRPSQKNEGEHSDCTWLIHKPVETMRMEMDWTTEYYRKKKI